MEYFIGSKPIFSYNERGLKKIQTRILDTGAKPGFHVQCRPLDLVPFVYIYIYGAGL
jgi:hypothetical protein